MKYIFIKKGRDCDELNKVSDLAILSRLTHSLIADIICWFFNDFIHEFGTDRVLKIEKLIN